MGFESGEDLYNWFEDFSKPKPIVLPKVIQMIPNPTKLKKNQNAERTQGGKDYSFDELRKLDHELSKVRHWKTQEFYRQIY